MGEGAKVEVRGRDFPKASSRRLAPGISCVFFPRYDPLHTTHIPHSISFNFVCCRWMAVAVFNLYLCSRTSPNPETRFIGLICVLEVIKVGTCVI